MFKVANNMFNDPETVLYYLMLL